MLRSISMNWNRKLWLFTRCLLKYSTEICVLSDCSCGCGSGFAHILYVFDVNRIFVPSFIRISISKDLSSSHTFSLPHLCSVHLQTYMWFMNNWIWMKIPVWFCTNLWFNTRVNKRIFVILLDDISLLL